MKVRIKPGFASGKVPAPCSKSYAHRLLICAALAEGKSVIRGVSASEDIRATLDCIKALGAKYELTDETVLVHGGRRQIRDGAVFPCRESGSTLRFLIPLALTGAPVRFTGAPRLMERGVGIYETVLGEKGIRLEKKDGGLSLQGTLTPGEYALMGNVSSQYVSGLMFALPLSDGDSLIRVLPPVESRPYIDVTLDALRRFGIRIDEEASNCFHVPGGQKYLPAEERAEGDWSNAASLFLFNSLGGEVAVTGLNPESRQGDRICLSLFERLRRPGARIDLTDCPDLGPVLFAAAAAGHGGVFTGTRRLRIKESDRAQVMAKELAKFGAQVEVGENEVTVRSGGLPVWESGQPRDGDAGQDGGPSRLHPPTETLDGHNDHRIVMALSALLSRTGGEIDGAESVRKSFPDYFEVLGKLGLEVEYGV